MKKLLTILLLASCSAFGQSNQSKGIAFHDTLKYQISKHGQHKEGGTEYTSVYQLGDTVTTRYNFQFVITTIRWRNPSARFEYFGTRIDTGKDSGFILERDLKLK